HPEWMLHDFLERLAGTPARLEERTRGLGAAIARARVNDSWSVQQNAGHLGDVEELWKLRIRELAEGVEAYSPANPEHLNHAALRHQDRTLAEVLATFRAGREELVAAFRAVDPSVHGRSAHHARLGTRMRLVDLAQFAAEHDDHHLLRIAFLRDRLERA